MAQVTKQQIIECTLNLAEQKSLSKIKVKDITDACGITRNTFYYHFHDIIDVLKEVIQEKLNILLESDESHFETALFDFFEFCVSYKKVWLNLYKTLGHDMMTSFLSKRIRQVIIEYIYSACGDFPIADEDIDLISDFYVEGLIGVMFRWLKSSRDEQDEYYIKSSIDRIRNLFDGQMELLITNSRRYKAE